MPTNIILYKMKVKSTENCEYCGNRETIEHLFFFCPHLDLFWKHIAEIASALCKKTIVFSISNVLFGINPGEIKLNNAKINLINHIILIAKMAIHKYKFSTVEIKNLRYLFENEFSLRKKYFPLEPD